MMNAKFTTVQGAVAAGYRPVDRSNDKDVSGHNSFGYTFERDGERSVKVWFTDEPNQLGKPGCFVPMFPPRR